MSYVGFIFLVLFALLFSAHEKRVWTSGRTPFAFFAYPSLLMLFLALSLAPALGFYALHLRTILATGLSFVVFAIASIALSRVAGDRARMPSVLEASGRMPADGAPERTAWNVEYLVTGAVILAVFSTNILDRGAGEMLKGELAVGSIASHLIELGIAYLVIAASQRGGKRLIRTAFILLVLWVLAINQVKYLIMIPLAAAVLYRWVSGQLATWKVLVMGIVVPLGLVTAVYGYFGVAAASGGVSMNPALVLEIARHMVAYLVSGFLGLDRLLMDSANAYAAFGPEGLEYAFAPFVNLAHFIAGAGNYFNVVNPDYPVIHPNGLDTNVFTLFGSLLYRGGWVAAVFITLAYALFSYWVWTRWRMRHGALACAAGSWWMATILFGWFDPFFIHLSVIEIMTILTLRGSLRLGHLVRGVPRAAAGSPTTSSA